MQELPQLRLFCFYSLCSKQKVLGKNKSSVDLPNVGAGENVTLKLIALRPGRAGVVESDYAAVSTHLRSSETLGEVLETCGSAQSWFPLSGRDTCKWHLVTGLQLTHQWSGIHS